MLLVLYFPHTKAAFLLLLIMPSLYGAGDPMPPMVPRAIFSLHTLLFLGMILLFGRIVGPDMGGHRPCQGEECLGIF